MCGYGIGSQENIRLQDLKLQAEWLITSPTGSSSSTGRSIRIEFGDRRINHLNSSNVFNANLGDLCVCPRITTRASWRGADLRSCCPLDVGQPRPPMPSSCHYKIVVTSSRLARVSP